MGVYSTQMRYTGLSGVDTDSMVKALMAAESLKYDRMKQNITKLQWKQDAYRTQMSAMTTFQSSFLNVLSSTSMRMSSSFSTATATAKILGAETAKVSVKAGSTAKSGDYSLKVSKLAQTDAYISTDATGKKTQVRSEVASAEAFDYESIKSGDSINVTLDGVTKKIDIYVENEADFEETINKRLKDAFGTEKSSNGSGADVAKVTAGYKDGKLSFDVSGTHSLKLSDSGRDISAMTDIKLSELSAGSEYSLSIAGKDVKFTFDENSTDAQRVAAINKAIGEAGITGVSASADSDGLLKFSAAGTSEDITIGLSSLGGGILSVELGKTSVLADLNIANGSATNIDQSKTLKSIFGSGVGDSITFSVGGSSFTVNTAETSLKDFMAKVNKETGVRLSFDSVSQSFKLESSTMGAAGKIDVSSIDGDTKNLLKDVFKIDVDNTNRDASLIGQDAEFYLNGDYSTRSTNNFTIGSLTLTLNETTGNDEIKITVGKNTDTAFDNIKKFVDAYNNLIAGLNGAIGEKRATKNTYDHYEPLTDDQRSGMSDSDILNWEAKAKTGMLNRDPSLSSMVSTMRSELYRAVDLGDGRKISLYEIGITTSSDYTEQGKLVIDEAKLRKALEERGEDIETLFTKTSTTSTSNRSKRFSEEGIAERLNDIIEGAVGYNGTLTAKVGMKDGFSELTNDMYKQIKDQNEKLSELLISLRKKEENYYYKFSKMESALTNSNSQMTYLQSLM